MSQPPKQELRLSPSSFTIIGSSHTGYSHPLSVICTWFESKFFKTMRKLSGLKPLPNYCIPLSHKKAKITIWDGTDHEIAQLCGLVSVGPGYHDETNHVTVHLPGRLFEPSNTFALYNIKKSPWSRHFRFTKKFSDRPYRPSHALRISIDTTGLYCRDARKNGQEANWRAAKV